MIVIDVLKIIDFRLEHKSGGCDFFAHAPKVNATQAFCTPPGLSALENACSAFRYAGSCSTARE